MAIIVECVIENVRENLSIFIDIVENKKKLFLLSNFRQFCTNVYEIMQTNHLSKCEHNLSYSIVCVS